MCRLYIYIIFSFPGVWIGIGGGFIHKVQGSRGQPDYHHQAGGGGAHTHDRYIVCINKPVNKL